MTPLPALVEPVAALDNAEIERYSRHIIIPEIGDVGQRRLKNAPGIEAHRCTAPETQKQNQTEIKTASAVDRWIEA